MVVSTALPPLETCCSPVLMRVPETLPPLKTVCSPLNGGVHGTATAGNLLFPGINESPGDTSATENSLQSPSMVVSTALPPLETCCSPVLMRVPETLPPLKTVCSPLNGGVHGTATAGNLLFPGINESPGDTSATENSLQSPQWWCPRHCHRWKLAVPRY